MTQSNALSRRQAIAKILIGTLGLNAARVFAANDMPGMDMGAHGTHPFPDLGPLPPKPSKLRKLTFAWNENGVCSASIPVAVEKGLFEKYGVSVDYINYSGSTDQLLEAIATGKADGAVGMALRWLKPLDQGFDVKLVAGLHGGCMRLLCQPSSHFKSLADLKGKVLGTSDMASPDKAFFSILLQQAGVDPNNDVSWRAYPGDLLPIALKRGDVAAISGGDPLSWEFRKQHGLQQLATNMDGPYAHRACCVIGVRGELIRKEPYLANVLVRGVLEGGRIVAEQPAEAAAIYAKYAPKTPVSDLTAMLSEHAHHDQEVSASLRSQIEAYANDLKGIGVFQKSLDAQRFASKVTADPFQTA